MVFGSLTAMRGVAALLVAFFHLRYGVIGVPLFDLYIFQFRFGNRGYLWGAIVMVHRSLWKWNARSAERTIGTRSLSDRGGDWSEFVSIECALSVAKNGTNLRRDRSRNLLRHLRRLYLQYL